ncbi:TolB family protein [Arachidicoccus terrestris]|uniref:TolB family protein n=1 Tax=Arachidicoccus terrestris TaxID=2875539 RepID=UPI001CC73F39|nr:hypothetical protein [Arachidicoccus terrestris]UAY57085.1 hypothetical protein K9M52_08885 [Arachidicoccus terrestris]
MKKKNNILIFACVLCWMSNAGCSKNNGTPQGGGSNRIDSGLLYYSAADKLVQYDFSARKETTIYSDGDHYQVSPHAKRFIWYRNDFTSGSTYVQIHNLLQPTQYRTILLPCILEGTPKFISESSHIYAALAKAADGAVKRTDLIVFNGDDSKIIGRIPHVKSFCVTATGKDLVLSAEAFSSDGTSIGYALAVIKNFQSANDQQSLTIHEYPDYGQLPEDMAASPAGEAEQVVFVHLDHLYSVNIQEGAQPRQLTGSRFREADPGWSKDGKYIVFTANTPDRSLDCGEIRIIPATAQNIISVPEDLPDNEPADLLQPVDINGKSIHGCGSESYLWR